MGEIFVGSEVLADGSVTRYELTRWYRAIHPNVYTARGRQLTLRDRALAASLWSKRRGILTGVAASAVHGAEWVDADTPIELVHAATRPPAGVVTRDERIGPANSVGATACSSPPWSAPRSTSVGICGAVRRSRGWTR
ncbi:hypothetical protein MPHLEI_07097 [Mycolicibacterium phlei RIVM601174]|nr:hypothetical protein MPHLEI_07097 [Mycolicibacterium phlei RIVM601174]